MVEQPLYRAAVGLFFVKIRATRRFSRQIPRQAVGRAANALTGPPAARTTSQPGDGVNRQAPGRHTGVPS